MRSEQQFREIDKPRLFANVLVELVEMNQLPAVMVTVIRNMFRAQAVIFLLIDEILNFARHPCRFIELEVFTHAPEQTVLIFRVEDLK